MPSGKCKAILRSGARKGEVCDNSTNGGCYGFCIGHAKTMYRAMKEGEEEERRLQGEDVPKKRTSRRASRRRKVAAGKCVEPGCKNKIKTGNVFCKKCLERQWEEETADYDNGELEPIDSHNYNKRLSTGFFLNKD